MSQTPRVLFAFACLFAGTVAAQQENTNRPTPSVAPKVADEETSDVRAFWTAERLASAKPMPIPKVDPSSVIPAEAPIKEPIQLSPGHHGFIARSWSAEVSAERFPLDSGDDPQADITPKPLAFSYEMPFNNYRAGNNTQFPYYAIGKLFFTVPTGASEAAGTYVCSATVINDGRGTYGLTVVTARHCVYDITKKIWFNNWAFFPGWNNGPDSNLSGGVLDYGHSYAWTPNIIGTWTSASTLSLTTGWDIAMMEMHDSDGAGCNGDRAHPIGYYTGWLGYSYGGDFTQRQWNILGYPQAAPFEGNYLYNDEGATGIVNPLGSTNVVEVGNPQTGGTSGGPWLLGFDISNDAVPSPNDNIAPGYLNVVNGVNSFVWTSPSEPLAINGTIFQTANFYNLLTFMKAQTCK
jgi:V8-like Glu-specific endopeptidase